MTSYIKNQPKFHSPLLNGGGGGGGGGVAYKMEKPNIYIVIEGIVQGIA